MKRERRKERDAFAVGCERIEYAMRQHDHRHVRTDAPAIQIGFSARCDKRSCYGRSERKEHGMSYRSMVRRAPRRRHGQMGVRSRRYREARRRRR